MKKLKIGVIGVGNISELHIDAYLNNPECELYAFCDIDEGRLKEKADKYKISRRYTDCREMLRALPELDAVSVCTWNCAHADCAIAALEAGKHVFCEKPMAMNAQQAEAMRAAAQKAGKVLGIGFVRRHADDAAFARELVQTGKAGEIYYSRANYIRRNGNPGGWFSDKELSGGGPLIDLGVHVIDLVRYIVGNPRPVSVYGATFSKLGARHKVKDKRFDVSAGSRGKEDICNVEDLATALIRFEDGSVLHAEMSFALNVEKDSGRIELFGTKGGITIDPAVSFHTEFADRLADITFPTPVAYDGVAFRREIGNFVDAVLRGAPLLATADDGVEMMKILDAVYESARTGHEVILG